ncbi:MAG TPA: cytochrome c3 family protein [Alphaproteobacteria bacterium]|nr:cytochrome c3 family protein [Alphaproteobacteria bacterium]
MRIARVRLGPLVAVVALALGLCAGVASAQTPEPGAAQPVAAPAPKIPKEVCLACHGNPAFAVKGPNGETRSLFVDRDKFGHSVHGNFQCVDCHTNVTKVPHQPFQVQVDCVSCHEQRFAEAQKSGNAKEIATMGFVAKQIDDFFHSIHARPSFKDQSRTNATCYNCHQAHYVYPPQTPIWQAWRMNLPYTCGACHQQELADYKTSIHGVLLLQAHAPIAPTCADCHTSHQIENPNLTSTRLVITQNCGSCHKEQLKTYLASYHGQVERLGYGYTAKCFDCHGYHKIQLVTDPRSTVYPANRLATCRKCHAGASAGFITFEPHGNTDDFQHYPALWLASKFMALLLIGVFAFFWTHSALWFYRSYKERKARGDLIVYPLPAGGVGAHKEETYIQRFPLIWRIAHLIFLLTTMTLVLTGMAVRFSGSFWAPTVAHLFGGPRNMALVHHTCAAIFLTVFFIHVVIMTVRLAKKGRGFRWFGPDSLVIRWQDFFDAFAMFKWFFGYGPRPVFDRWTYWEKFDYWAVFWGVTVIGGSGAILLFHTVVSRYLPGYVFNLAMIFHGEEAVLAAVFLFTVHFFNNHFRPDKFPLDTVMFTGAYSLEEFKREHAVQYQRLVESGELEKHRVPAPSHAFALGSRVLGFTLIAIGLFLLALVLIGLIGSGV